MAKLRIGVLASGGGSNMQSIIDACKSGELDAEVCVVISNNSKAYALERAKNENIPYYHISKNTEGDDSRCDEKILEVLNSHNVNLIALAGYMKMLGEKTLMAFHKRALNIHPALLPKFGGQGMYGMNVHRAVINAGENESGATIHVVSSEYDEGRILNQIKVSIDANDTAETLAEKVLEKEHLLYKDTLKMIADGTILLD